jgi:hypothetical protein
MDLSGDAYEWWDHAAGVYARGHRPEPGAVLSFRSNSRMRLGHVAVVRSVKNSREIEIDHANWPGPRGRGVNRNIAVVDVSPNNDWTAVRVAMGYGDTFGSIYPTNGFIYDRPDNTRRLVTAAAAAPIPALNPPPTDLRPASERTPVPAARGRRITEVAEAPVRTRGLDLTVHDVALDAPYRNLR